MTLHWWVFIAVVVIVFQTFIYRRWAFKRVTYERYFSTEACYEGESVQMIEQIANRKLLPLPWMRLESAIHAHLQFEKQTNLDIIEGSLFQHHKSLFSLMPYAQITRRHHVVCRHRGYYILDSAHMTGGDVLGLLDVSKKIRVNARLLVYPKPIPYPDIPLPSHSWLGDVIVRRWIMEDPFMTSGAREYRYGDPLNSIHWKATARSGHLQVHKRDFTADHHLMIYLNVDISDEWDGLKDPERIETGIRYAASIAQRAIAQGVETGFGCNGRLIEGPEAPVRVSPESGKTFLLHLYEIMAKLVLERSVSFHTFLQEDVQQGVSNADFLLITSFVSDRIQECIEQLQHNGNSIEILPLEPSAKKEEVETDEA